MGDTSDDLYRRLVALQRELASEVDEVREELYDCQGQLRNARSSIEGLQGQSADRLDALATEKRQHTITLRLFGRKTLEYEAAKSRLSVLSAEVRVRRTACDDLEAKVMELEQSLDRGRRDIIEIRAEKTRLYDAWVEEAAELEQVLGKVLGYPWYKDDQKNFPGATEAAGVCVGDHVTMSLVAEAAHRIEKLKHDLTCAEEQIRRTVLLHGDVQ